MVRLFFLKRIFKARCTTTVFLLFFLLGCADGFTNTAVVQRKQMSLPSLLLSRDVHQSPHCRSLQTFRFQRSLQKAKTKNDDDEMLDLFEWDEKERPIIIRGTDTDEIDGSIWEDLATGEPPKWLVMKELLGVNIFTYMLAALIAFFLGMNVFLGPGWLGQILGMSGVGSFEEVSDAFPDTIDVSAPEFRL